MDINELLLESRHVDLAFARGIPRVAKEVLAGARRLPLTLSKL